jgi:hypothetical protein
MCIKGKHLYVVSRPTPSSSSSSVLPFFLCFAETLLALYSLLSLSEQQEGATQKITLATLTHTADSSKK